MISFAHTSSHIFVVP